MDESTPVIPLPVRREQPGLFLTKACDYTKTQGCQHDGQYTVDSKEREVVCAHCEKRLDPMQVLIDLSADEERQRYVHVRMAEVEKRFYHRQIKRLLKRRGMPRLRIAATKRWLERVYFHSAHDLATKTKELETVLREAQRGTP